LTFTYVSGARTISSNNFTETTSRQTSTPPRIWLVIGDKLGDNAQVTMIANSLGLAYTVKHLSPRQKYILGKPRFKVSLEHLDADNSDALSPPWPDLVITAGRRHAMAALWIKQQSPKTKIILLGRPRRWIDSFDLVITLPQYHLPDLPQVMRLSLPLMRTDSEAVSRSAKAWAPRLESLPRPIIAVLIGSATRPFRFGAKITHELLTQCSKLQSRYGGSLYFSTSRRTTADIVDTLRAQLPGTAQMFEWRQGCTDNPYLALLEHADYFVVTGDSVSMMIEVADRGKPMAIFQLPASRLGSIWLSFTRRVHARPDNTTCNRLFRWMGQLLYQSGVVGFSRDLTQIHKTLIGGGFAVRLGETFNTPSRALPNELDRIRQRILELLAGTC
jgi:mitochondrial fission protein ELM1